MIDRYKAKVQEALKHRDDGPNYWGLTRAESPEAHIDQAVYELVMALVGQDESSASIPLGMPESIYNRLRERDKLRAELRQAIKPLDLRRDA